MSREKQAKVPGRGLQQQRIISGVANYEVAIAVQDPTYLPGRVVVIDSLDLVVGKWTMAQGTYTTLFSQQSIKVAGS